MLTGVTDQSAWPLGPPARADTPTKWWLGAAALLVVTAACFGWLGNLALQLPGDGTDASGMAAMSCFALSAMFAAMAVGAGIPYLVVRSQSRRPAAPGWYGDPTGQARFRWWDGDVWTAWTC